MDHYRQVIERLRRENAALLLRIATKDERLAARRDEIASLRKAVESGADNHLRQELNVLRDAYTRLTRTLIERDARIAALEKNAKRVGRSVRKSKVQRRGWTATGKRILTPMEVTP